jgi:REP element-mobilizing transposase RayT
MSQSLSMLYVHVVFSTKNRIAFISNENIRKELYSYIAKIIYEHDSVPIEVGGHKDHVHIFLDLSKNLSLKQLVRLIKVSTSKWLKTRGEEFKNFHWQNGYGGFSIGEAHRLKTIDYIKTQDEHHHKISFQEEFIIFLKKNNMDYSEKYMWD